MESNRLKAWLVCVMLSALSFQHVQAQTFAEWFSQKKTQLKYLTQQIAALEQYGKGVEQGYQIAKSGWGGIGSWVKGESDLHSAYYSSLRRVNSTIKSDPKADSIVIDAQLIPRCFDRLNGLVALDQDTQNYIRRVTMAVLEDTDKDLSELELVMTDGKAQLSDDERIKRLDNIYKRVKDRLGFTQAFCNGVRLLLIRCTNTLNDLNTLKSIYGIN